MFDQIEQLKQEYTDKYVVVDESRPELHRFRGMTGTVRTVNMNGRALVEFDANLNIGWYDIDLDFLKVIDKPLEKPDAPKPAAKPAKPAAKPAAKAKGGAPSAADILAAARGGAAPKKEKPAAMSPADILAAARGGAAAKPAESKSAAAKSPKADPSKMSAADILAAARGGAAPAAEPASKPESEPVVEESVAPEPVPAPATEKPPAGDLPTNVDDILAFCRERDGS